MTSIGFIGLGHMGLPMAINLTRAGYQVLGFDLSPQAREMFLEQGGHIAQSLDEIIKDNTILITMVQSGAQVKQICLGHEGLYAHSQPGLLHLDCSTIDVESSHRLYEEAQRYQLTYVDAPVSGGVKGAKSGSLTFMVGGDENAFNKAHPLLEAMGKKIFHTGKSGSGQAAKICNNMILGISMIAISEAFTLAQQLGLSAEKLFEVVNNASGQCWAMSQYVPVANILPDVPANNQYQPGFASNMMLKDLRLSQEAAQFTHTKTPLGALATQIYQQFSDEGFGELDFSAIVSKIQALSK